MMRKPGRRIRKKSRSGRAEDELSRSSGEIKKSKDKAEKLGAFYAAGPVLALNAEQQQAEQQQSVGSDQGKNIELKDDKNRPNTKDKVEPVLPVQVEKEMDHATAFGNQGSVRLRGRTEADFSHSYETINVTTTAATGCRNCSESHCIRARGTLVNHYRVATTVSLPSASDFPDLSDCQRQRVQAAINNTLAPHEQDHVRAFNTYRGTTRERFDLTLCRSEFNSTIRSMAESSESARQSAAQAASDALDPFYFDVDINCEDVEEASGGSDVADDNESEKRNLDNKE